MSKLKSPQLFLIQSKPNQIATLLRDRWLKGKQGPEISSRAFFARHLPVAGHITAYLRREDSGVFRH